MSDFNRIEDLANATAYDVNGEKVGSVKDVYVNDTTGQPDFISVNHGLFGSGESIVPLRGHSLTDGDLHLAFPKERIEDAPDLDENGHLTNADQEAFYRHYGLEGTEDRARYATGAEYDQTGEAAAGAGYAAGENVEADRREFADAQVAEDGTLIRSEEQLNVGKERVEAGQVRLRKYVVHETETVEVPVEREEVRITREPITDADRANFDGQIGEAEASVTLHEDRVTVSKESVPVEKVSLGTETVQETQRVSEDVAKERIETDGQVVEGVEGERGFENR
ncbi:PRC and DUF2382 domain-containing protein [Corynebacterium aquatimens]|uniref:Uncharacterized protein (TIGR02271 family) n=1 Tax=Corynebacterium aquatimens TaxID=1190508 RepID=A0A931DZH7_9CORY|nr:PRC and DUF2382 domain-containing protein [Corynebacterium aquatimens]MBG6122960.1 uncharacterized protein (TIGR02271 family) [Corynebacterium aquatimens]WJY66705.1 Stress response protein YsnF [Corynebacterium aquatimens]